MLLLGRGGKHGGVVGLWRIACHGRLIVLHFLASISAHHVTNFDTDVAFVVHAHSQTVAAVAPLLIILARIGVLGFLDVFDIVFVVANLCFQLSNERRCGRVVAFHQRRQLPCCAAHERQVIISSAGVDIVINSQLHGIISRGTTGTEYITGGWGESVDDIHVL